MRIKTKMRGIKSGHVDSDSDGLEVWDGVSTEEVVRDIPAATPLPEPEKRKSKESFLQLPAPYWICDRAKAKARLPVTR